MVKERESIIRNHRLSRFDNERYKFTKKALKLKQSVFCLFIFTFGHIVTICTVLQRKEKKYPALHTHTQNETAPTLIISIFFNADTFFFGADFGT